MGIESLGAFQIDQSRTGLEQLRDINRFTPKSSQEAESPRTPKTFASLLAERTDAAGQSAADPAAHSPDTPMNKKLYQSCQELETFFLKTLISSMRKTVDKSSGITDLGFAGNMYEDMLYDEYTKQFAQNANFGFARLAYLELTGQRGTQINHHL